MTNIVNTSLKFGIIGGSGFDDPNILEDQSEREVSTPFGSPSDRILEGTIAGVPCAVLGRHGRKHQHQPSDVNYRANIWALKEVGCTHILATTATGSLAEEYKPGDLVVLDDFIDKTWGRKSTFYDRTPGGPRGVCHLPLFPAFCPVTREAMIGAAKNLGHFCHERGTCIAVQGPRFSTRAESFMHRQWGCHLINMTISPEAALAKEAGLAYASLALVTDYDCWRVNERPVSVEDVLRTMSQNVEKAAGVIVETVKILSSREDHTYIKTLKDTVAASVMLKE